MSRIAYSIFDYENLERVVRLVNRIQTKSDFVHIHLDTRIGKEKFFKWKKLIEKQCQKGDIEVVSEFRCNYGSFGIVEANLNAMRDSADFDYDYFIDLSGDSYPLKSPEEIKKELDSKNYAYMEFFTVPYKDWAEGGLHRIKNKCYFIPRKKYPFVWTIYIPRFRILIPDGLTLYGGRGSRCLQKRHVSYILNYVDKNPNVKKFFRRVWGPGELFYQTILLNSPLKDSIVNESKMYMDFSEGTSHPRTLTGLDLPVLKKSGKFFARKFSTSVDKDVLDSIDQIIEDTNNF